MHPLPLGPIPTDPALGLLHLPPSRILLALSSQAAGHIFRIGPRLPRLALGPPKDGALDGLLDAPIALGLRGVRLGRQRAAAAPTAAAAEGLSTTTGGSLGSFFSSSRCCCGKRCWVVQAVGFLLLRWLLVVVVVVPEDNLVHGCLSLII